VLAQLTSDDAADHPQALFLDEPTASLDLPHQSRLLALARERTQAGTAVLAILHDLNLAMAFADEVWLMQEGRLVLRGNPEAVLAPAPLREVFGVEVASWRAPGAERPVIAMCHGAGLGRREVEHA
jgi:iron complex transport system ATP-binding protein